MTRIGFIGAGRMASAIVTGLLRAGGISAAEISCVCGSGRSGAELSARTGITRHNHLNDLLAGADTVVVACKPQQLSAIQPDSALCHGRLFISILAGTTLGKLGQRFPGARNIVRSMPNTPGQIGAGVSAYCSLSELTDSDRGIVHHILGAMGTVIETTENHLDAVTAISGSGPAYLFEFAAALREGAIGLGLDPSMAETLVSETLAGSAQLLRNSPSSAEELREQVTSPGGTTAAALEVFKRENLRSTIATAVRAARDRSVELSRL